MKIKAVKRTMSLFLSLLVSFTWILGSLVIFPGTGVFAAEGGPGWYYTSYEEVIGEEDGTYQKTVNYLGGTSAEYSYQGIGTGGDFTLLETIYYQGTVGGPSYVGVSTLDVEWETPASYYAGSTWPEILISINNTDDGTENYATVTSVAIDMMAYKADGTQKIGSSFRDENNTYGALSNYQGIARYYDHDYWGDGSLLPIADGEVGETLTFTFKLTDQYHFTYQYEWRESSSMSSTPTVAEVSLPELTFTDFDNGHWAYPYVQVMVDLEIISGYPDNTFRPDDVFNRAAFAKLLSLSFDVPAYSGSDLLYEDLMPDHWAYSYVMSSNDYLTAFEKSDGSKVYLPNDQAVREDVAVAMVKAMGLDPAAADMTYLTTYVDEGDVSNNLREYVALAIEYGVMQGANSNFRPKDPLTRAEASTLFARFLTEIKDTYNDEGDDDLVKVTN